MSLSTQSEAMLPDRLRDNSHERHACRKLYVVIGRWGVHRKISKSSRFVLVRSQSNILQIFDSVLKLRPLLIARQCLIFLYAGYYKKHQARAMGLTSHIIWLTMSEKSLFEIVLPQLLPSSNNSLANIVGTGIQSKNVTRLRHAI